MDRSLWGTSAAGKLTLGSEAACLKQHGVAYSTSPKGDSLDDPPVGRFFSGLKWNWISDRCRRSREAAIAYGRDEKGGLLLNNMLYKAFGYHCQMDLASHLIRTPGSRLLHEE